MTLNPHDQARIERIAQNWRLTPATLAVKLSKGAWIAAPWLRYAATRIALGIHRGNARIIISAPPRHGKSELVNINTPIWVLENYARRNIILASYGADLSVGFGRRVRNTIQDNSDLLRVRIADDSAKADMFGTSFGGYMASVGLGGAITGRGAHVLLIDDYIKEIKEALSPAWRDYIWNWFVTVAMTRLEPGASVIIIATRWHSDDLHGRILKNFPGQWENICLPAEALENDLLGRAVGDPLFPERYSKQFLLDQKELLGSVFYHALYQQGPMDEVQKFTDITWLQRCKELMAPDFRWARCWDLAASQDGGDYTAGSLIGYSRSTNKTVIGNVIRRQLSPDGVEKLVRNTAIADGVETEILIEQEPGASGKTLVHHYQEHILQEYKVSPVPTAGKNKLIRAQPFLAACEAGKVYLLDESAVRESYQTEGKWQDHFEREFEVFPNGPFDDQVDTVAAGYNYLSGKKVFSATFGRKKKNDHQSNSKQIRKASFMLSATRRVKRATFGRA